MAFPWVAIAAVSLSALASPVAPTDTSGSPKVRADDDAAMHVRVDSLIGRMTIEEKAAQISILGDDAQDLDAQVRAGLGGTNGVLPGRDVAAQTLRLQQLAMQSRLKIPLWFLGDTAHGFRTIFPMPLALAASWDPALVTRVHRAAASEATASGVTWTFSPMVDIARDPRWGRIVEGAGEDPYLGSVMAVAQMRGFEGKSLADSDTMMATAKHFAGYGAVQGGRDYNATWIPERQFRDLYLPPFKALADAGIGSFMAAFTTLDGVPATSDHALLTERLRDRWHYTGVVVSDFDAVPEIEKHGTATSPADAARQALMAGIDIDLHSGTYLRTLPKLVRTGVVSMARVDQAVRRVLEAKWRLGLFADPYRYNRRHPAVRPMYRDLAREAARETMVLLKNPGALLPPDANRRVAVIGPLADAPLDPLGPMHAQGEASDTVTMRAGIEAAVGARASYAMGVDVSGDDVSGIPAAVAAAKQADVAILVLGESIRMIGEGNSRSAITLPGEQRALAEAVLAIGKPVVIVIVSGRPLDLSWLDARATAIVDAWLPGHEGGNALADLLYGKANFSGKLPVTFPRALGQVPLSYDYLPTARPADPHDSYTSHYVDLPNTPLYPFGYGLSYTSFAYDPPTLDRPTLDKGQTLTVTEQVRNTGKVAGATVVQLYVHDRVASVSPPVRQLKRFERVMLAPGETKTVRFTIAPEDLAFMRRDRVFGTEPGDYDLYVGGDSTADTHAAFALTAALDLEPATEARGE